MQKQTINDLKLEFGEVVLNTAIVNLVKQGTRRFDDIPFKESLQSFNKTYDEIENDKKIFPFTREFALQVLSCEYQLFAIDEMEILTYFKK